jgi:O-antigen ligase
MSIVRLTVYALFFVGLSRMLNSQRRIDLAVLLILVTGCFEALYGMVQTFSGNEHIWWVRKIYYRGDVTGTYVNRNHFAGLMEIIIMLAALYPGAVVETKKGLSGFGHRGIGWRQRLSRILSGEQRFNKGFFVLFSGVVMGLGLLFSGSRGAMLGAAAGLFCMSLFLLFKKGHRRKGLLVLVLFLITTGYALRMGVERPLDRFKTFDASFEVRTRYAERAFQLFQDYPVAGVGVGNFRHAYPKYQAPEDTKTFIDHAHNDWVQFLAEAGIAGFAIFAAGLCYYLFYTLRLWLRRHDPFAVTLGAAPFTALAAIAIHSWSDFNLHYMTNSLMLLAVMAIGFSALHLEKHHNYEKSLYQHHVLALRNKGYIVLVPLLALILWCALWAGRHFMGEAHREAGRSAASKDYSPLPLQEIKRGVAWDPWNTEYWWLLGLQLRETRSVSHRNPDWPDQDRKELQTEIIRALEQSVRLNPLREEYHLRLGWEYTFFWGEPDASTRWMPAADLSMERAAFFAGTNNPYLHVLMGHYWLMRSKTLHPGNPMWELALAKARWHYRTNLSIETGRDRERMKKEIVSNIWVHYPDQEFVNRILGEN